MYEQSALDQSAPLPVEGKTFGSRALAYIIDSIIYAVINIAVSLVIGIFIGIVFAASGREIANVTQQSTQCLNLFIGMVQYALYFTFFEWLYGASFGKIILGMRVVAEDGSPVSFMKALTRALLRYVDAFFFALPAYYTMKPPRHQRIGDKSAGTMVVDAKNPAIKEPGELWQLAVATGLYLIVNTFFALLSARDLFG